MAKKLEPIESVTLEGEEYFTVPALAEKYKVHPKRIHNCMARMKIPRKQLGTMVLIKDDPRFDPSYVKPNPGAFKKGDDERRSAALMSYVDISHNTTELVKAVGELREMIGDIYYNIMGREFGEVKMDDNGSTIDT